MRTTVARHRVLVAMIAAVCAAFAIVPVPASASTASVDAAPQLYCPTTGLYTAYGPGQQCARYQGDFAHPCMLNLALDTCNQNGPNSTVYHGSDIVGSVMSTDGYRGLFRGAFALNSPYGPISYGEHYHSSGLGRFGIFNLYTEEFKPTSGWLPSCVERGCP